MRDGNGQPATKADVSLLKAALATVKADVAAVKTDLTAQINRVAAALVNTQADVRDMATKMSTKDDISRVLSAIDAFAKQSESDHGAVAIHGHVLTKVQVGLKDHEGRIKTLESARP